MAGVAVAAIARVPLAGVGDFQAYEARVLPLLVEHGGRLDRRLRNADGTVELHIVRFTSRSSFDSFRADPRRLAAAPLLASSGARLEVIELTDVD